MAERGKLLKKIRRKQAQFRASEPEIKVAFIDDSGLTESVANHADRPTVPHVKKYRTISLLAMVVLGMG